MRFVDTLALPSAPFWSEIAKFTSTWFSESRMGYARGNAEDL
jgi:hypothetical protein